MKDRAALLPNRRKITYEDGSVDFVTFEYADQPTEVGTLLNTSALLSDAASTALGLTQTDPVPSDAFTKLGYFTNSVSSNLLINDFRINQRAVTGTVTLAAGVYGHDRWKGGASGCTYTFATSANVTTVTISAGSLIQVVEGISLKSGTVCLSWEGTTQGKIGAGSYGNSGITGTAVGGTNLNIEFGTGTLASVQLNYGSTALPFVPRSYGEELRLCQRYCVGFENTAKIARAVEYTANTISFYIPISTWLRASPTPVGTVDTDWYVASLTGTKVTGFTITSCLKRGSGVQLIFTKTSHGLTEAVLGITGLARLDIEL